MSKSWVLLLTFVLLISFIFAQSSEESSQNNEDVDCAQHNACGDCTDESGCVWCETDSECVNGGFFGPSTILPSCSNWNHKQCTSLYNFIF